MYTYLFQKLRKVNICIKKFEKEVCLSEILAISSGLVLFFSWDSFHPNKSYHLLANHLLANYYIDLISISLLLKSFVKNFYSQDVFLVSK